MSFIKSNQTFSEDLLLYISSFLEKDSSNALKCVDNYFFKTLNTTFSFQEYHSDHILRLFLNCNRLKQLTMNYVDNPSIYITKYPTDFLILRRCENVNLKELSKSTKQIIVLNQ